MRMAPRHSRGGPGRVCSNQICFTGMIMKRAAAVVGAICALFACFTATAAQAQTADFVSGLVAYYPFEGTVNDSSGYHYNGTATNITYTAGKFAQGASFTAGSSYVSVLSA